MDNRSIKKQLRQKALARRDALDPLWRIEASIEMADAAGAIPVEAGEIVSGFWPMRSEVDVRPLMFAFR
jgi:5-formyltetrahydrofolate cyclo-ligase